MELKHQTNSFLLWLREKGMTECQIDTAKKLFKWLATGNEEENRKKALQIYKLLGIYPLKKINSAMGQCGCTSLLALKRILEGKSAFKSELQNID